MFNNIMTKFDFSINYYASDYAGSILYKEFLHAIAPLANTAHKNLNTSKT